eukprot:GHVU01125659.1.p1 GENE.GHVU01125659.1~~GHVU01125659.1.p1  ORF type:complete len:301 (+),score=26.65 GHVU01125659.1:1080-1982(+)
MATISHISDKVLFGEEVTFGTLSGTMTKDFGVVESVSATENENTERIGGINSGHKTSKFADGLYYVTGTLETLATKDSLPNLLEAFFGSRSDSTDYTITSTTSRKSYSLQLEYTSGTYIQLVGVVFKTINLDVAKDGNLSVSMDYVGKKLTEETGTLTVTDNTDKIFKYLDVSMTYAGTSLVTNSMNISGDWNIDDTEGRGIESVAAGERRLIQRVVSHALNLSGSFEVEVKTNFEVGYEDERTDKALLLTVSRETDNEHIFNLGECRLTSKDFLGNTENSRRLMVGNYEAKGITITGDL